MKLLRFFELGKLMLGLYFLMGVYFAQAQTKIPLTHDVYDTWQSINKVQISNDGKWICYELTPFTGDAHLILYNTFLQTNDTLQRAYDAAFMPQSDFLIYKIKAFDADIRKAKIQKKKASEMPKDSLGIYNLNNKENIAFANLKSFKLPSDSAYSFAFTLESIEKKDDKSDKKKNTTKKENQVKTGTLYMAYPHRNKYETFNNVSAYAISSKGERLAFVSNSLDSINVADVHVFDVNLKNTQSIFRKKGEVKNIVMDKEGKQLAFLYSSDTTKTKKYALYYFNDSQKEAKRVISSQNKAFKDRYSVSEHTDPFFSKDNKTLYWFYGPYFEPLNNDSIPDDEKVSLDIWAWTDSKIQSQQLADLDKDLKKTYLASYCPAEKRIFFLANDSIETVSVNDKHSAFYAIGILEEKYMREASWAPIYKDYFLINLKTNNKKKIIEKQQYFTGLSPQGNYVVFYSDNDSLWYAYHVNNETYIPLTTKGMTLFYNTERNLPNTAPPYGLAAWTEDDKYILLYDKYDIWKIDLEAKEKPVNLTENLLSNKSSYRFIRLDDDELFIKNNQQILVKYVDETDKHEGFFYLNWQTGEASEILYSFSGRITEIKKAKNNTKLFFRQSNFIDYPDIWVTDTFINKPAKISCANPQQKDYLWGSVELIKWEYLGKSYEGLLYKPENFIKNTAYPTIVYLYERNTQNFHLHYTPNPSRSVINFPLYTSNGYVIFVPDIDYTIGFPGESALNAVLGGVAYLTEKGIADSLRLGIQGQSWGGYQAAYIITRTPIFKAAMAGAPVSNMTSAYGGIRRKTGINRIHQYEIGQSRIGATLWDSLSLYIENSPLFFANKIQTPLLMMSNDNDGAVPWEQGIELFLALRRLNKPVWMLNYNKDEHNLTKKPHRVDLSIRMLQFFDHYLKDTPAPIWMVNGIKAIDKNRIKGLDFLE